MRKTIKQINCFWSHSINQIVVINKTNPWFHEGYTTHTGNPVGADFSHWLIKGKPKHNRQTE